MNAKLLCDGISSGKSYDSLLSICFDELYYQCRPPVYPCDPEDCSVNSKLATAEGDANYRKEFEKLIPLIDGISGVENVSWAIANLQHLQVHLSPLIAEISWYQLWKLREKWRMVKELKAAEKCELSLLSVINWIGCDYLKDGLGKDIVSFQEFARKSSR